MGVQCTLVQDQKECIAFQVRCPTSPMSFLVKPTQPAISDKSFFIFRARSKKRNCRDEIKSVSYDYAQQPNEAIYHSPIDSYEYRKLVFLIHKSIFVYAANSQFGPTFGSFCY